MLMDQITGLFASSSANAPNAFFTFPLHPAPLVNIAGNSRNSGSNSPTAVGRIARCANSAATWIRGGKIFSPRALPLSSLDRGILLEDRTLSYDCLPARAGSRLLV